MVAAYTRLEFTLVQWAMTENTAGQDTEIHVQVGQARGQARPTVGPRTARDPRLYGEDDDPVPRSMELLGCDAVRCSEIKTRHQGHPDWAGRKRGEEQNGSSRAEEGGFRGWDCGPSVVINASSVPL